MRLARIAWALGIIACGGAAARPETLPRSSTSGAVAEAPAPVTPAPMDLTAYDPEVAAASASIAAGDLADAERRVVALFARDPVPPGAQHVAGRMLFARGFRMVPAALFADVVDDARIRLENVRWLVHLARVEPATEPDLQLAAWRLDASELDALGAMLDSEGMALVRALYGREHCDGSSPVTDPGCAPDPSATAAGAETRLRHALLLLHADPDGTEVVRPILSALTTDPSATDEQRSQAWLLLGRLTIQAGERVAPPIYDGDGLDRPEPAAIARGAYAEWAHVFDDPVHGTLARVASAALALRLREPRRALALLGDLSVADPRVPLDAVLVRAEANADLCRSSERARFEEDQAIVSERARRAADFLERIAPDLADDEAVPWEEQVLAGWPTTGDAPRSEHLREALAIDARSRIPLGALVFGGTEPLAWLGPPHQPLARMAERLQLVADEARRLRPSSDGAPEFPWSIALVSASYERDQLRLAIGERMDRAAADADPSQDGRYTFVAGNLAGWFEAADAAECHPVVADTDLPDPGNPR